MPRISSDYTIAAGEVVRLTTANPAPDTQGNFGLFFSPPRDSPGISFRNFGRVEFASDERDADLVLLRTDDSVSYFEGIVWENHGALSVTASQGGARGYFASGAHLFRNTGTLTVEGKLFAAGYQTYGAGNVLLLDNRGQILVRGTGSAEGVFVRNHNTIANSGLISATSESATDGADRYAYGVIMQAGGMLTNAGRVVATNTAAAKESTAVFVGGGPFQLLNTGELVGYEALYSESSFSALITNNGLMDGLVVLGNGADRLTNAGRITGQIQLRDGQDIYDGVNATTAVRVDGGAGNDTLNGGAMSDSLAGGGDRDSVFGGQGADTIDGGEGVDYLRGDDGSDSIAGGLNFDDINGNMGNDTADGGAGDDWVVGGKDNDLLFGGADNDIVYGNIGADTLHGESGADLVRGGQGNDVLNGMSGADWLSGDRGNDTMSGGSGPDIFHSFGEAEVDRVTDFNPAEGDRVLFDPGTTYTLREEGGDTIVEMSGGGRLILVGVSMASLPADWASGIPGPSLEPTPQPKPVNVIRGDDFTRDSIVGTPGQDSIAGLGGDDGLAGGEEADTLDGGAGDDRLTGDGGADVLIGGDGQDSLQVLFNNAQAIGGAGDDGFTIRAPSVGEPIRLTRIDAGSGSDIVHVRYWEAGQRLVVDGGDGFDQVNANMASETLPINVYLNGDPGGPGIVGLSVEAAFINIGAIFGGDADEVMSLHAGRLEGGGGNDDLSASNSRGGASTLNGGAGDDHIYSGLGADSLSGGVGSDTLSPGAGTDTLAGAAGADRINIGPGIGWDQVLDFNAAEGDRVQVTGAYTVSQVGADTVIVLGAEADRLVLMNVQLSSLPAGWIFGS